MEEIEEYDDEIQIQVNNYFTSFKSLGNSISMDISFILLNGQCILLGREFKFNYYLLCNIEFDITL